MEDKICLDLRPMEEFTKGVRYGAVDETLKKCKDIIIPAWEALPDDCTLTQMENWLLNEMMPAIAYLRGLKAEDLIGEE